MSVETLFNSNTNLIQKYKSIYKLLAYNLVQKIVIKHIRLEIEIVYQNFPAYLFFVLKYYT